MKFETLKKRLDKNRPMTTITIRMPEDVIEKVRALGLEHASLPRPPQVGASIGIRRK